MNWMKKWHKHTHTYNCSELSTELLKFLSVSKLQAKLGESLRLEGSNFLPNFAVYFSLFPRLVPLHLLLLLFPLLFLFNRFCLFVDLFSSSGNSSSSSWEWDDCANITTVDSSWCCCCYEMVYCKHGSSSSSSSSSFAPSFALLFHSCSFTSFIHRLESAGGNSSSPKRLQIVGQLQFELTFEYADEHFGGDDLFNCARTRLSHSLIATATEVAHLHRK